MWATKRGCCYSMSDMKRTLCQQICMSMHAKCCTDAVIIPSRRHPLRDLKTACGQSDLECVSCTVNLPPQPAV